MGIGFLRRWFERRHRVESPKLEQTIWGVRFPNPVGLAPGFDKNAEFYNEIAALGFGFVEIGTVTAQAQGGNPKPRMFRLKADAALINRMGFNNEGSELVAERLAAKHPTCTLGVNIGRTKIVSNEGAIDDYRAGLQRLWSFGDYVVVNVSSPNTPDLRDLQGGSMLRALLGNLRRYLHELAAEQEVEPPPMLVKIAPDLSDEDLNDICDVVKSESVDGIIAVNTTISREGLNTSKAELERIGNGGLSGLPLRERAPVMIGKLRKLLGPDLPIVGVGGVDGPEQAWRLIRAGASLVQVYTGLIYGGPTLIRDVNRGLLDRLTRAGFNNIADAVGTDQDGEADKV